MGGAVLAIKGVLMTDLMIAREHRFNEDAPAIAFVRAWISFVYGYGRGRVKSLMFALCFRREEKRVRMVGRAVSREANI